VIRVLVCDDAVAFSTLLGHWFVDAGDVEVVGVVSSGKAAIALSGELLPDVIVLDHLLHDVASDVLAPELREAFPKAALLLISGLPTDALEEAAHRCGADAFLSKASTADDFLAAVRTTAAGGRKL
jgi:DNA-binding NarL/FixJ family response regulator